MPHVLPLDWMPGPHDGLIVGLLAAVVMAPRLILNGLLATAIPGIIIGIFTARKIEGSPIGPNLLIGTLASMIIEAAAYVMQWWPYSSHDDSLLIPFFLFRSLLPIWLIATLTSKMMPSPDN
jgi:hypothetical protein